jgi:hypothetical protein
MLDAFRRASRFVARSTLAGYRVRTYICGSVQDMSAGIESPVFVGRRAEMAVLAALVQRALAGESAFALICGEAGVGKTRLAGELVTQAAEAGFTVLVGHCIELGAEGLPLAPLVDALRTLARTTPPDELAEVLGPGGRGLARLLPEHVATSSADPGRPALGRPFDSGAGCLPGQVAA